ncbi:MAG: histidinol-phosphate transaminase [Lachnospiraceae bacterium]|nr:histidinol-phosphate transaminase [Lachnospiraceae bacterium]
MSFTDSIRRVTPYVPGEQPKDPDMIKLNTNENPYPPSPAVEKAFSEFSAASLRLYPDPAVSDLVAAIAEIYGVSEEEVFVGVGSDDVLAMCFLTFFNSGKPVLFPDITYSFYDVWAELFRIPYRRIPLLEDFTLEAEDYLVENGGIIFPNPNAPTGLLLPLAKVEQIVRENPDSVVIVDEAYIDFGGESALPLTRRYNNLIVVQTFSKSRNLAGMRIGFAIADRELIAALSDVKYSFNSYTMNAPSIAAGTACMRDTEYFRRCTKRIMKTRAWAAEELRKLGFIVPDSASNFLFVTHKSVPAEELFNYLKMQHIYVRYFKKPRIDNYLRITIGTDAQMETLIRVLRSYLY